MEYGNSFWNLLVQGPGIANIDHKMQVFEDILQNKVPFATIC